MQTNDLQDLPAKKAELLEVAKELYHSEESTWEIQKDLWINGDFADPEANTLRSYKRPGSHPKQFTIRMEMYFPKISLEQFAEINVFETRLKWDPRWDEARVVAQEGDNQYILYFKSKKRPVAVIGLFG